MTKRLRTLLLLVVLASGSVAGQGRREYHLTVVDDNRTSLIRVTLDAPLNADFPAPTSIDRFDLATWSGEDPRKNGKQLLHADIGLYGGLFRRVRGNLGVSVIVHKVAFEPLDVRQLYKVQVDEWHTLLHRIPVVKSDIVTIGGRQYSYFEAGREEARYFYADYSLPLTGSYYVTFGFDFVTNDFAKNPKWPAQAHELIGRIMQSVSVEGSGEAK